MRPDERASAIALPLVYRLMGRPYASMLRDLHASQALDPEALDRLQFARLTALLDHCYANVPYYRSLFDRLGAHPSEVRSLSDYARLPMLDKDTLRAESTSLVATDHRPGDLRIVHTGGSTGEPVTLYQDRAYYDRGWAAFLRNLEWTGHRHGERQLWFGRYDRPSLARWVHLTLERKRSLGVVVVSENAIARWVEEIRRFRPRLVYGYPTTVAAVAAHLLEHDMPVDYVRQVMTSSETLFPHQREEIGRAFGAPVFNQFGSTETRGIASECTHGSMHVNSDVTLVEYEPVVGSDGVASHEVVVTPLYGYGMPLLRYRTGDRASPAEGRCSCGLPFPLMRTPEGRVDDTLVFSDGSSVSAMRLERLVRNVTGVARFQFRQTAPDSLELLVVPDRRFDDGTRAVLADIGRRFADDSGVRVEVIPVIVDEIATTPSGKHRSVVRLERGTPRTAGRS